jgi:Tol biopolymer transport system component
MHVKPHSPTRRRAGRLLLACAVALALALGAATPAFAASAQTTLVSLDPSGQPVAGASWPSLSADGRYVAFWANSDANVLVRDRQAGSTSLVPGPASAFQYQPATSADGNVVALTVGSEVYAYDVLTGKTTLVSQDPNGKPGGGSSASPTISGDGRYIAFSSYSKKLTPQNPDPVRNEFVRDMKTGKTEQVNVTSKGKPANGMCHHPSISADGRYVAFESNATNIVNGTKGWNIFVRDLKSDKTRVASLTSSGKKENDKSANPWISGDGRYVVFESRATNLVKDDTNKKYDIFRRDLKQGKTVRVSVSSSGKQANGNSRFPSISNHGGYIAFYSEATNLVSGDTNKVSDAFFRDERKGKTARVSVSSSGEEANSGSIDQAPPSITGDGLFVAFTSAATNLVPDDTNGSESDVFLRGPLHG